MIVDRRESHFIFLFNSDCLFRGYNYINYRGTPLTKKEYLEHWGKYVFFGTAEYLHEMARKLDRFVERKEIPHIKYDRRPLEELGLSECVMCVYCDDRQKQDIWRILNGLGIKIKAWAYDRETMARWSPGGFNLERWISAQGLGGEEAERVREEARLKFEKMFADENGFHLGVEQ